MKNVKSPLTLNFAMVVTAVTLVSCICSRSNFTWAITFVVKSAQNGLHERPCQKLTKTVGRQSNSIILTRHIEIIASASSHREVFDEISESTVAAIPLQIVEREWKVHQFCSQAEIYIIDAESIEAIN